MITVTFDPATHAIVPREPADAMIKAATREYLDTHGYGDSWVRAVYSAFLAAAPEHPSDDVGDVLKLAHRIAWRYKKSSDPHHSDTYTFNEATLLQFAAAIAAQKAAK